MQLKENEKFVLPRNLRGRSIHTLVIPTVDSLKNMLVKLKGVNGDVTKLKPWERSCYKAYRIEKIKHSLLHADREEQITMIRKIILSHHPTEMGANCIDIYLVAYVAENFRPGQQAFVNYVLSTEITDKFNSANAIWQVGKSDGVFLNILNKDGSVKD